MIIETQHGDRLIILGPGDVIEALDEDIWYETKSLTTPLRIGSYNNREEARNVMKEIRNAYVSDFKVYRMPK